MSKTAEGRVNHSLCSSRNLRQASTMNCVTDRYRKAFFFTKAVISRQRGMGMARLRRFIRAPHLQNIRGRISEILSPKETPS